MPPASSDFSTTEIAPIGHEAGGLEHGGVVALARANRGDAIAVELEDRRAPARHRCRSRCTASGRSRSGTSCCCASFDRAGAELGSEGAPGGARQRPPRPRRGRGRGPRPRRSRCRPRGRGRWRRRRPRTSPSAAAASSARRSACAAGTSVHEHHQLGGEDAERQSRAAGRGSSPGTSERRAADLHRRVEHERDAVERDRAEAEEREEAVRGR